MLAEKSGKTLHLLKSGSKPIKPRSKRKQIPVLGSLKDYHDSKKKPAAQVQQPLSSGLQQPAASGQRGTGSVQQQITDTIMIAPLPNTPAAGKKDLRKEK